MILRPAYLEELRKFIDTPLIKVITGIRRSGKSAILHMLKNELTSRGISEDQILYINFESMNYTDIDNASSLYQYIKQQIQEKTRYYILLDEIQDVTDWEKAINSFRVDFDCDIYLTGSNSRLLSSELSTFLAGRYVEIHVWPLSFREFLTFRHALNGTITQDRKILFESFLRLGGFPVIHTSEYDIVTAYQIVGDIYASAILRDTVQRHNIRNTELLERIVKFVFDNIGNKFSAKSVADYFKNQQRKIDLNTVYNYLNALETAFIITRIHRYDIKGKEILQTNEKYYLGDPSLLYAVMGYRDRMIGGVLENIVLLEIERRGYRVWVGKLGDKEVDFIAERLGEKIYVQVSYKLSSVETVDREFGPLRGIADNYPKYVVTMDDFWKDTIEGIRHVHIANFLLMEW